MLPYFGHWSKTQVKKVLPSLNVITTTRGQTLVHENTASSDVYIVRKGEFRGFKTFHSGQTFNPAQEKQSVKQFIDKVSDC